MSDAGSKKNTSLDLVEEIFRQIDGKSVYIPSKVARFINETVRTRKGRDVCTALFSFFECRQSERKERKEDFNYRKLKKGYVEIHNKAFTSIASSSSITKYKKLLIDNGFVLENRSWRAAEFNPITDQLTKDGWSISYKPKSFSNYVEQELNTINFLDVLGTETPRNPICNHVRRCLNTLELDRNRLLPVIQNTIVENAKFPMRFAGAVDKVRKTKYPLVKLAAKRGRINRDSQGRLHSPWSQLKGDYRKLFSSAGERLLSADMVACQPTLIGILSEDAKLIEDCQHDRFYNLIIKRLNDIGFADADRDDAKSATYPFIYGKNRTHWTAAEKSPRAVQELFNQRYSKAAKYCWEEKMGGKDAYKKLPLAMQKLESKIFIDGLYNEIRKEKLFCLPIHDGFYFRANEKPKIAKIVRDNLSSILTNLINSKITYSISLSWNT